MKKIVFPSFFFFVLLVLSCYMVYSSENVPYSDYRLTIFHNNDVHSRIDPFQIDGSINQGPESVAATAEIIGKIRSVQEDMLLMDAGDIFQGTPYFNIYKGEPEIKAMTMMGYEATTVGNRDIDAGMENLTDQLIAHARFPMLVRNYDFSGTQMGYIDDPYQIIKRGKILAGVFEIGIEVQEPVAENLVGSANYPDPLQKANKMAAFLKKDKKCDLVICLSHLSYRYSDNKISDEVLAKQSENIDLIIGGHTHTFLDAPVIHKNKIGSDVIINQVGWAGIVLGRLDFEFSKINKKN